MTAPYKHQHEYMPRSRGFLPALFDLSFTSYVTVRLVRGLYRTVLVFTVNVTLCGLLFAWWLPEWFGWGIKLAIFILSPLTALMWLILARVILEHFIVVYSIAEDVSALAQERSRNRN